MTILIVLGVLVGLGLLVFAWEVVTTLLGFLLYLVVTVAELLWIAVSSIFGFAFGSRHDTATTTDAPDVATPAPAQTTWVPVPAGPVEHRNRLRLPRPVHYAPLPVDQVSPTTAPVEAWPQPQETMVGNDTRDPGTAWPARY